MTDYLNYVYLILKQLSKSGNPKIHINTSDFHFQCIVTPVMPLSDLFLLGLFRHN